MLIDWLLRRTVGGNYFNCNIVLQGRNLTIFELYIENPVDKPRASLS